MIIEYNTITKSLIITIYIIIVGFVKIYYNPSIMIYLILTLTYIDSMLIPLYLIKVHLSTKKVEIIEKTEYTKYQLSILKISNFLRFTSFIAIIILIIQSIFFK